MSRTITTVTLTVSLVTAFGAGAVYARGFGGGFRGGGFAAGGFRGGYGGGFGGYHASYGGYRGGFGGGGYGGYHASGGFEAARGGYGGYHASGGFEAARGGYGGEAFRGGYSGAAFGRTPSFSSAGTFERSGGEFRGYNPYAGGSMSRGGEYAQGAGGGRYGAGYTSGSYTTQRGGTIDYGAAGRAAVGPGGGAAARGVGGVQVTTAGGRTFTDVGRAGGAVGPGKNAVAGRSNVAAASGPRGTAVEGSRGVAAAGPGGVAAAGERGGAAVGRSGAVGYRSTYGAAASGGYGAAGYHYGAAGYHYGATGYRPYGYNAYGAYHAGWVHGYWNGQNSAAWGWRGPYWGAWGLAAAGLGWGLSNWGFGSALYGMGYLPYANPYYGGAGGGTVAVAAPYDYAQPIDTVSAPAPEDVTSQAVASFDAAREAFHQGDYAQALQQADAALAQTPNDTALHEFRALCLFALGRYDEAAAVLYAVLSVGPGWDWSTLIGLYPDVGTYTAQLRALEAACAANPQSAADRFVLAYHYLTQGHTDAAVRFLKQVVALKPDDSLSARLLKQLAPPPSAVAAAPAPATAADTTPPPGASLTGTWTARPAADTTVTLGLQPDGHFTWGVTKGGKTQQFTGTSTFGDGLLTLAQDNGPVLVGRVSWADPSHMTFRIAGDGPEDPGLSFAR